MRSGSNAGLLRSIERRRFLTALSASVLSIPCHGVSASDDGGEPVRFGLTPVFLSNDLELLGSLKGYLKRATGHDVQFVTRRTYQEITAMLVSGQLDAAWICGYPFVQYRERLDLVAVPVWRGAPLYQSYLIARRGRRANDFTELEGDLHAFSDPDSNSGYLVTRALLAEHGKTPATFFRRAFFTYGHRNVVRAVASGLAESGSVDGYVFEVLREVEPVLIEQTVVVRRSDRLGFPPIACPRGATAWPRIRRLITALVTMDDDPLGLAVLDTLRLDGFTTAPRSLFDPIAQKMRAVLELG